MKYFPRVFSILLFLVLVTSAYVGHTVAEFAKEASGSDNSRITKFGVTATVSGTPFSATYGTTVKSSGTDKVFAPGTSGTFSYAVTGTPEVNVQVTKTATIVMNSFWTDSGTGTSGSFYCPLTFTVGSTVINGLDYATKDEFKLALKTELEKGSGSYSAGSDLGTKVNLNRTVTWSWPYTDATGDAISQSENNDNALGSKSTKPSISITMAVDVVQID